MTLHEMQTTLKLSKYPACFPALYDRIQDTWKDRAALILSDYYIYKTLTDCYALLPYRDAICAAAAKARETPALCLFICILEQLIVTGGTLSDPDYEAPAGEGSEYDLLHLFPAIPTMPGSVKFLRDRQVPEDIIAASLQEYDDSMETGVAQFGRPVFNKGRLGWLLIAIRNHIVRIDRFKYDLPGLFMEKVRVYENSAGEQVILADGMQVHRSGRLLGSIAHEDPEGSFFAAITETEDTVTGYPTQQEYVQNTPITLEKSQWTLRLTANDPVIRIHIPKNEPFDPQIVEASYQKARSFFARHFPDYPYKAFYCNSWLMSQELPAILKPTSNILAFQKKFTIIPSVSVGRAVFAFVFQRSAAFIPASFDDLPRNTSLERAIIALYENGGYIHEGSGFFF